MVITTSWVMGKIIIRWQVRTVIREPGENTFSYSSQTLMCIAFHNYRLSPLTKRTFYYKRMKKKCVCVCACACVCISMHQQKMGATQLESSLTEKDLGSWWSSNWTGASSVPLPQRRLTMFWAASDKVFLAGQGRWSFPSTQQHWWGHAWSTVSSSGILRTRETHRIQWRWWRDWSISPMRTGWESWDCSAQRREGSGGILSMCINTWRESA